MDHNENMDKEIRISLSIFWDIAIQGGNEVMRYLSNSFIYVVNKYSSFVAALRNKEITAWRAIIAYIFFVVLIIDSVIRGLPPETRRRSRHYGTKSFKGESNTFKPIGTIMP